MTRNNPSDGSSERSRREQEASAWVIKRFKGLTAEEQDAFFDWLAADPENEACFAECKAVWKDLDLLAEWRPEHSTKPNPDLLDRPVPARHRKKIIRGIWSVGLAACVAVSAVLWITLPNPTQSEMLRLSAGAAAEGYEWHRLEDGSVIELNRGAQAAVHFDARTRWVELERGEAHFTIAKDGRPFVVTAGGVLVQAVGTVFKVRIEEDAVDVLVTEGQVKVGASIVGKKGRQLVEPESLLAELNAGHRSVVGLSSAKPATSVVSVTSEEIERELSWLEALLDFRDEPLSSIVMEFNRRNSRKIVIEDPAISEIRLTAAIRPNNIDGLVELLELTTPVRAKSVDDNIVILSR